MKQGLILLCAILFVFPAIVRADALELESVEALIDGADGKPVVITYWATWCETCLSDLSELEEFHASAGGKVSVYSINATKSERSVKQVRTFIEKSGLQVPVYLDMKGAVAHQFRQVSVPFTILVDKSGKKQIIPGPVTKEQLDAWID
ncbi:Thiol-disulfide isomerase or thioredoxin [Terribacillus halophilus]|uniref:Thiol-disulfide isomerase or thioredoxin n=1 Tax=Terribacillus halophilus TaxID=361279 RepID=A0A1G6MUG6_9BACI|nr:TlpA disulfide reductase family protein [Terribacillus halophilus]SDC59248.1 Thiol-disulfide isomerase or thioredoxin [Terribacillus halophilus]